LDWDSHFFILSVYRLPRGFLRLPLSGKETLLRPAFPFGPRGCSRLCSAHLAVTDSPISRSPILSPVAFPPPYPSRRRARLLFRKSGLPLISYPPFRAYEAICTHLFPHLMPKGVQHGFFRRHFPGRGTTPFPALSLTRPPQLDFHHLGFLLLQRSPNSSRGPGGYRSTPPPPRKRRDHKPSVPHVGFANPQRFLPCPRPGPSSSPATTPSAVAPSELLPPRFFFFHNSTMQQRGLFFFCWVFPLFGFESCCPDRQNLSVLFFPPWCHDAKGAQFL